MTQPEALRLADELEKDRWQITGVTAHEASEELRRLHDLLGKANALCRIRRDRIEKLEAVMVNAQGNLERIFLEQTGVGIGTQARPVKCEHTWIDESSKRQSVWKCLHCNAYSFTAPPRQPLTDEQIDKLPWEPHEGNPMTFAEGLRYFARAIEAAHGITQGQPVADGHVTDGTKCWCEPELDYKDPDTGAEVWIHRGKQ